MGHVNEPIGIDLIVGPMPYSNSDKQFISSIIQIFKRTGKKPDIEKVGKKYIVKQKYYA